MTEHQHETRTTFEDFVNEHGARLLRTAVLLAHDEHDGQDLLQDALEKAFKVWDRNEISFPAAYVRAAMVRILQRRRLQSRLRLERLEGHDHSDADPASRADERAVLLAALATLPARRRAAVVLRHWEGYSEAETAELLGCSVGTVKSQTHRGLLALRTACGSTFPDRVAPAVPSPLSNIDVDLIGGKP